MRIKIVVEAFNKGTRYEREPGVQQTDVIYFDCRILDNPHRHPNLRALTGKHPEIQAYVRASPGFDAFWQGMTQAVVNFIGGGQYLERPTTVAALGCAFGKHQSRAVAYMLREYLIGLGFEVKPIEPYTFKNGKTDEGEWEAWA